MNPGKITLIRDSFALVLPVSTDVGLLFYRNLFSLDPSLKPMFSEDLTHQSAKLMQMLGAAVNLLDKLDDLVPVVQQLAKRHLHYGVKQQHYAVVGEALINTLVEGLGDSLSAEACIAWKDVYSLLSEAMISAAYSETIYPEVSHPEVSYREAALAE